MYSVYGIFLESILVRGLLQLRLQEAIIEVKRNRDNK